MILYYRNDQVSSESNLTTENMSEPIYPGSSLTVLGVYCILMEFKRSCRLSFTTMAMLLNLLQLICPTGNKLPTTKYQLLRFAVSSKNTHSRIDYCRFCATKLQRNQRCPSSSCQRSEPNSIIFVSPENTLQHIISGNKYLCICYGMLWTN